MSPLGGSNEEQSLESIRGTKQRRLQGACDNCRKRKIRCDSARMPGRSCTHCVAFNIDCTHVGVSLQKRKTSAPSKETRSTLEERLQKVESLLTQIHPELDYNEETGNYELNSPDTGSGSEVSSASLVSDILENRQRSHILRNAPELTRSSMIQLAEYARQLENKVQTLKNSRLLTHMEVANDQSIVEVKLNNLELNGTLTAALVEVDDESFSPPNTTDGVDTSVAIDDVVLSYKRTAIDPVRDSGRFFGKSSDLSLLGNAVKAKLAVVGGSVSGKSSMSFRRPMFWALMPYSAPPNPAVTEMPVFEFPGGDVLAGLVEEYFKHVNNFLPLLHKPTFCANIANNLHYQDKMFGGVVLMVCALGSIYSDDVRVYQQGVHPPQSRGFPYFFQLQKIQKSLMDTPSLHELQIYCLLVMFLHGTSASHVSWTTVGVGIRYAQEVGAHRRKKTGTMTMEDELWKRCFWCLVLIDRILSSFTGRPCGTSEEDFDAEMPAECDDEYWDHGFLQPPSKPAKISYFNSLIRLTRVLSRASRTIYAVRRPPIEHLNQMISELDSEMNSWMDSIPEHLRWDPAKTKDSLFFIQSASLYTTYYFVQIQVHRLFVPTPSQTSYPSLLICANAARACVGVMDIYRSREPVKPPFQYILVTVFTSGIVLLLNLWATIKAGRTPDPKDMKNVQKCLEIMRQYEDRWRSTGRLWDILNGLASHEDTADVDWFDGPTRPPVAYTLNNTAPTAVPSVQEGTSLFPGNAQSPYDYQFSSGGASNNPTPSSGSYTSPPSVTGRSDIVDPIFDVGHIFGDLRSMFEPNPYGQSGGNAPPDQDMSPPPDLPGLGDWWQSYFTPNSYEFGVNPFTVPTPDPR